VEADKERITQVVSNLLNNSVKFTEEGTISIDVKVQEDNNDIGHNIVIVSGYLFLCPNCNWKDAIDQMGNYKAREAFIIQGKTSHIRK
jgi:signal transduction histidine kinase